jgi:hypothetical protein
VATFDANGAPLPGGVVDGAASLYVSFGSEKSHYWKLFVGTSDVGTDPAAAKCSTAFSTALLTCNTSKTGDGGLAVTTVLVARAVPDEPGHYAVADVKALTDADLPELRVERNVRVFHPNGTMTSVTEGVVGPKSLDPDAIFTSSASNMTKLATDPEVARVPAS